MDIRETFEQRGLIWIFAIKELSARYRQTLLGPLWFFLQPLLMTGVFTLIFSKMLGVSTGRAPAGLFYLSGLALWTYFSQVVTALGTGVRSHGALFRKVYFPRLTIMAAPLVSNAVQLVMHITTFFVVALLSGPAGVSSLTISPWAVPLLPLICVYVALMALGVGLVIAAMSIRFRDLHSLVTFLLQMWMFGTPIIWDTAPGGERWRFILDLNPMAWPIRAFRGLFLDTSMPTSREIIFGSMITILLIAVGIVLFRRAVRDGVDVL